jgi:hypothetical protein
MNAAGSTIHLSVPVNQQLRGVPSQAAWEEYTSDILLLVVARACKNNPYVGASSMLLP